jgi:hypothetical protein
MTIADTMLWRLVWKEYRAQRSFWLAIAGTAVGLMLLILWLLAHEDERLDAVWGVALVLPLFYALGSAAVVFASETEEGTTDLLRIMPTRSSHVFLGKVAYSLVSTAALCLCLLVAAGLLTLGQAIPKLDRNVIWASAAFVMQTLSWGFVFSALCRKVLTAVCLTAVISMAGTLAVHELFVGNHRHDNYSPQELLLAIPLLLISYLLTWRTMTGRSLDWSLPQSCWRRVSAVWRGTSAVSQLERLAAVRETAPPGDGCPDGSCGLSCVRR